MIRDIAAAQALAEEALRRPLDDDEAERFRAAVRAANARHLARTASTVELQPEPADQPPLIAGGEGHTDDEVDYAAGMALAVVGGATVAVVAALVLFGSGVIP